MRELVLHTEFFCVHDLIQARYELVRSVRQDRMTVREAGAAFGFRSRSSYYLFARLLREQGLAGLFDLRPVGPGMCSVRDDDHRRLPEACPHSETARPQDAVWSTPDGPWNNAFYGLQHKHYCVFVQVVRAFVEGNGVRGISRIFGIDKNTVLRFLERAALQCRRVTNQLVRDLHVRELQLDELWSFVQKKEKHLTETEYASQLKGDQWCWVAFDARCKVIVQYEIGKRTYRLARELVGHFRQRTAGKAPSLVTSDDYKGYAVALLKSYGVRGRGGSSVPPAGMDYAVVSKTRRKGRIVDIKIRVVFGSADRIGTRLEASPVSNNLNVAFVERSHLSRRQFNRRLTRKTPGFSKKLRNHLWQFELETAVHNFVRPHRSLQNRTPMMAVGKTDHPWSVKELLSHTGQ